MAREFCLITQETAFGVPTPVADRVLGTNAWYLRLTADNAFSMAATPVVQKLPYGGGVSTSYCSYSDSVSCTGSLQGECYSGSFTKFLLDLALTQVNAGRTTPWVTTDADYLMPPLDLASMSVYHGVQFPDGTIQRKLYNGVKIQQFSMSASRQDPIFKFNASLIGIRDDLNAAGAAAGTPGTVDATEFPEPGDADMPGCSAWLFSHVSAGGLKIATTRTQYGSVSLNVANQIAANSFESKYLQLARFCGRSTTTQVSLRLKASPDDLATYKAQTSMASQIKLDNGSITLTLDMPTTKWDTVARDLKLADEFLLNGTLAAFYGATAGTDVTVAAGTHA